MYRSQHCMSLISLGESFVSFVTKSGVQHVTNVMCLLRRQVVTVYRSQHCMSLVSLGESFVTKCRVQHCMRHVSIGAILSQGTGFITACELSA